MNIYLSSDLHLDIHKLPPYEKIPYYGGVLLLAGDICESRFYFASKDLRTICNAFDYVYAIPGNHEYYRDDLNTTVDNIRHDTADIPNFTMLQKDVVALPNGMTLIAATLWTDFNKGNPLMKQTAQYGLNDYNYITNQAQSGHMYGYKSKLHVNDVQMINNDHLKFIIQSLDAATGKCIVMTHHAPLVSHANPYASGVQGPMDWAYMSDLESLIASHDGKLVAWVHGHTHDERLTKVGNVSVMTHARGYVPADFDPARVYLD